MRLVILFIEITWLIYFVCLNIVSYSVLGSLSLNDRAMRQDIFNLGSHGVVLVAAVHNHSGKSSSWLSVLLGYELFRDVMNGINIAALSPLSLFQREIWIAANVLVWYQVLGTTLAFLLCLSKMGK
ncbi:MAG: hypothetical protein K2Q45_01540 [Nitrosomonas sp.]|nr:hypothetical protein [Nitrosomonas sp.]